MHNLQSIYTKFINLYYYKLTREICQQHVTRRFLFLIMSHITPRKTGDFYELKPQEIPCFFITGTAFPFSVLQKGAARQERVDSWRAAGEVYI